ncbi:hypothetical protein M5689_017048 [Euphorbia peplus]|nr:hypothetical protein M5689_017048 [Euphorbia peplus]
MASNCRCACMFISSATTEAPHNFQELIAVSQSYVEWDTHEKNASIKDMLGPISSQLDKHMEELIRRCDALENAREEIQ